MKIQQDKTSAKNALDQIKRGSLSISDYYQPLIEKSMNDDLNIWTHIDECEIQQQVEYLSANLQSKFEENLVNPRSSHQKTSDSERIDCPFVILIARKNKSLRIDFFIKKVKLFIYQQMKFMEIF